VVVVVVVDLDGDGDVEVDATVDATAHMPTVRPYERDGRLLEGVVAMLTKMR
jgi:hypothetical protein